MKTLNLNKWQWKKRPTGMTGYLFDLGTDMRLWWRSLQRHPTVLTLAAIGLMAVAAIIVNQTQKPVIVERVIVATALPTARPASYAPAVASGPTLDRAILAYPAPDAAASTALERGWHYQVLARSGGAWTQINVSNGVTGGADVWVRSADLFGGIDLATAVPTAAPAPPAEAEIVYVTAPAAAAAPTPAPTYGQPAAITADADRAAACIGLAAQPGFVCAVGANDGQVYWLPVR